MDIRPATFAKSPLSASPMNGGATSWAARMPAQATRNAASSHPTRRTSRSLRCDRTVGARELGDDLLPPAFGRADGGFERHPVDHASDDRRESEQQIKHGLAIEG